MVARTRAAIAPGIATIASAAALTIVKLTMATTAPVEIVMGKPVIVASACEITS